MRKESCRSVKDRRTARDPRTSEQPRERLTPSIAGRDARRYQGQGMNVPEKRAPYGVNGSGTAEFTFVSWMRRGFFCSPATASRKEITNMKIAFSTLGTPDFTWDEIWSMAKDLGFGGIEMRGRSVPRREPRENEGNSREDEARDQLSVVRVRPSLPRTA